MTHSQRALIIFPTFNEKENIEKIVNAVLPLDPRINVLIVDDNSPDGTGKIADRLSKDEEKVFVLHRTNKQGLGRAYLAGFKWAIERKFDLIFEMDADFSHNPVEIPIFLNAMDNYDLVLGSRYKDGVNVVNWPMRRLMLSLFANVYTRLITGLPVHDATGGFKCFRKEVLQSINLDQVKSNGYAFQIEMTFKAWKKGFKIKEISIVFTDRVKGTSKMSRKIVREAIVMVWKLRLASMFGTLK
ncbi:MAG: polyprenol monophosphomannose synthase [Bacteroidetes bacterium]|nr:polyprenol monophosphomannose synthase [Bacteroidota bacterium]